MENWKMLLLFFGAFNLGLLVKSYQECKYKKNAFTQTKLLFPLGMFVWGDVFIFSIFWALASLVSVFLNDWILFLLIVSLFWMVRSVGETVYWFNQQFSKVLREPPHKQDLYFIFQNESIWFVQQIMWQCITIFTIILSIYLSVLWINFRF